MQQVFRLFTGELVVAQIDKHQVHIGTIGGDRNARIAHILVSQALSQDARPLNRALLTVFELFSRGNLEGGRFRGNHVHERAALLPGEYRRVDLFLKLFGAQDKPGAGAA